MKKFGNILAVAFAMVVMTVTASAAISFDYSLEEVEVNNIDAYKIVVKGTDESNFTGFKTTVKFDNTLIVPIDNVEGTPITNFQDENEKVYGIERLKNVVKIGRDDKDQMAYAPGSPIWTINGANSELDVEMYNIPDYPVKLNNTTLLEIYFKFADGKTVDDLTADSFKVLFIEYGNGGIHYYGHSNTAKNDIENVTNNVIPAKTSADTFNDGVKTLLADSGIRYKTTFAKALKNTASEYGFVVTTKTAMGSSEILDLALVTAGKAVKGVAYDAAAEDTDIYWSADETESLVTAVIVGVPMNKDALQTKILIRSYYKLKGSDTVVYGKVAENTVYEIAKSVKTAGGSAYENNKDYIDAVIKTVEDTQTTAEVQLDVDPLFDIEA